MFPRELWRTTTFRLTALYGLVFAVGLIALLGLVYARSAVYLTRRVDGILKVEANALVGSPPRQIDERIAEALAINGDRTTVIALFSPSGVLIAGNLQRLPAALRPDGPPIEIPPTPRFHASARLIARRLPSGEVLVVGRDVSQLKEMRGIIASALLWSGLTILVVGLACGTALSIQPMSRLRAFQDAGREIAAGDLKRRMPTSQRRDELDTFAATVNYMMDEVERLMSEVRASTDTIAHDLRTPLTRARAQLHQLQQTPTLDAAELAKVIDEIDEVLERFRALLRISELEARERHAGFSPTSLADVVARVVELYEPLAEADGVRLAAEAGHDRVVDADPKLLFEAVSNLVDNAIKFTGAGGAVEVRIGGDAGAPQIVVRDNGPGIPESERGAVLRRFFRGDRDRLVPGSGLGLSVVAAIVRLHRFHLSLEDAAPGLRAVIHCSQGAPGR